MTNLPPAEVQSCRGTSPGPAGLLFLQQLQAAIIPNDKNVGNMRIKTCVWPSSSTGLCLQRGGEEATRKSFSNQVVNERILFSTVYV